MNQSELEEQVEACVDFAADKFFEGFWNYHDLKAKKVKEIMKILELWNLECLTNAS